MPPFVNPPSLRTAADVLFRLPRSAPCLRYVGHGARVCLATRSAFSELEETRRCAGGLIQVPEAPRDGLERALADVGEE